MTRSARTLAAGAGVLIALAACASANHTTSRPHLTPAFRARANAVCAEAVRIQTAHPFPLKNFDIKDPDPAELAVVAAHFSKYGRSHQLAAALTALGAPGSNSAQWQRLLGLVRQVGANADAQIAAARQRDVTAFESTVATSAALQRRIAALGADLGFGADDPCAREFG